MAEKTQMLSIVSCPRSSLSRVWKLSASNSNRFRVETGEEGEMELLGGGGGGDEDLGSVAVFPFWVAARRRFGADDPFFAAGNTERELLAKQVALDLTEDERHHLQEMVDADTHVVSCPIVGCGANLNSLEDFEDHYRARHTASCSVCSRVYPTSRLLSIHVSEAHDSFFKAKVARGFPMYECLVEGCVVKLKSYKRRQQHLVDKHKFPRSFDFFKKARPSRRQRQKNQRKKACCKDETREASMDIDDKSSKRAHQRYQVKQVGQAKKETEMEVEERMDDLVSAVSKLTTSESSPSSISFGHRHARGFAFVPRSVRQEREPTVQPDAKS